MAGPGDARNMTPPSVTRRKLQTPSVACHRQGRRKTGNTYNQHKQPPIGTTNRSSTRHHGKGSPRVKLYDTNQHSSRARLQHSNPPPSAACTPSRGIDRASQQTQANAKPSRAELYYNTATPHTSGDTRHPPPWGAMIRRNLWTAKDARPSSGEGKGGREEGGGVVEEGAGQG